MNLTRNTSVPALERPIGECCTWKTEAYCESHGTQEYITLILKCFTNQGSKPRRERGLSLLQNVQNGFGTHPVSYSTGTGDTFADGRGTGVWC